MTKDEQRLKLQQDIAYTLRQQGRIQDQMEKTKDRRQIESLRVSYNYYVRQEHNLKMELRALKNE